MNQAEFNDAVSRQLEKLTAENRALKKQLAAVDPEVLADMQSTMESAKWLRDMMATEKDQIAQKSVQLREEFNKEKESTLARPRNNQNLNTKQLAMMYDRAAEVEASLNEIRSLRDEVNNMKGSLIERQDSIVQNIDTRMNDLDTRAASEYIKELFDNEDRRKNNAAATELVQREIRNLMSNPSGMVNPEDADG